MLAHGRRLPLPCHLLIVRPKLPVPPLHHILRHPSPDTFPILLPPLHQLLHKLLHTQSVWVLMLLIVVWVCALAMEIRAYTWRGDLDDADISMTALGELSTQIHRPEM